MTSIAHAYRYLAPSSFGSDGRQHLQLATSGPADTHPYFFEGELKSPRLSAELLTAIHLIVGSRFFTPANSLARLIALADPVVTAGGGMLRFEGFSACCSAYIRADFLPGSYDGDVVATGTTNVDFNPPMRAALARVGDGGGLSLAVGQDALRLRSATPRWWRRRSHCRCVGCAACSKCSPTRRRCANGSKRAVSKR